jgi:hypothetical protein
VGALCPPPFNFNKKNMDKQQHTYEKNFEVGVEYSYDSRHKKVYDIAKLKRKFKRIIENLKNKK